MSFTNYTALRFFPVDCDTLRSKPVRAAHRRFGSAGAHAFFWLMQLTFSRDGYFLRQDELTIALLAEYTDLTEETAADLIACLVQCDFFDQRVYRETGLLANRVWQEKWLFCMRSTLTRTNVFIDANCWLLGKQPGLVLLWGERGEEKKKEEEKEEQEEEKEEKENEEERKKKEEEEKKKVQQNPGKKDICTALAESDASLHHDPYAEPYPLLEHQYRALCALYGPDDVRKYHNRLRTIGKRTGLPIPSPSDAVRRMIEDSRFSSRSPFVTNRGTQNSPRGAIGNGA